MKLNVFDLFDHHPLLHAQGIITYYTRPLSMTCFQSLLKLFIILKVLQIK